MHAPNDICSGQTLDGRHPLCRCDCDKPPGYYAIRYPKETPPIYCEPVCPPPEPLPGFYWADLPKNYQPLKYSCKYCPPKCCTRPCCLHVIPKESMCAYDDPCCAACTDHPQGMKPSGRYPPNKWNGPMAKHKPC